MIRRANERVTEIREQMRGGKGAVEISPLFEKGEYKGKARLIAQITLNPGCSIGEHAHEGEDEIYFFISGKGIVNDNGVIHEVTPRFRINGNGAYHSVENTGDEPLVLMALLFCMNRVFADPVKSPLCQHVIYGHVSQLAEGVDASV